MSRRLMSKPCFACGSHYTQGCGWCFNEKPIPAREKRRRETEADIVRMGIERAERDTKRQNPQLEDTV